MLSFVCCLRTFSLVMFLFPVWLTITTRMLDKRREMVADMPCCLQKDNWFVQVWACWANQAKLKENGMLNTRKMKNAGLLMVVHWSRLYFLFFFHVCKRKRLQKNAGFIPAEEQETARISILISLLSALWDEPLSKECRGPSVTGSAKAYSASVL